MENKNRNEKLFSVSPYCERDREIIKYDTFFLNDNVVCRGKKPEKDFLCAIGSAFTFGCFCENPYCEIVAKKYNLDCLNLGLAGAGPKLHITNNYFNLINKSKFCIVQIMAARSCENSLFDCDGQNFGTYKKTQTQMTPLEFWTNCYEENVSNLQGLILETQNNYVNHMIELLSNIKVPKILFYFSTIPATENQTYDSIEKLFYKFPFMVEKWMIEKIKKFTNLYVESICSDGLPQKLPFFIENEFYNKYYLKHKLAKKTTNYNHFYPSPEMHITAAINIIKKTNYLIKLI